MNTEQLNQALYDKMAAEQEGFRAQLLGKTPEEILDHAYEYVMREDILMAMEEGELSAPQAAALLKSSSPLKDVFEDFRVRETDHMDCQRRYEIVRKRRRNFVVFRRGVTKIRCCLAQKECLRFAVSGA